MTNLAEQKALVESFSIIGLYGYRDVSMEASHGTTILIAKNGSGKTTLLAALDAFLNCRFGRLSNIDFSEIKCKLSGEPEISISSSDIEAMMLIPEGSEFISLARRTDVEPSDLLDFLMSDYTPGCSLHRISDIEIYKKIRVKYGYEHREARRAIDKVFESLRGRSPAIDAAREIIDRRLAKVEVIYLPTYRRIELALSEPSEDGLAARRRQSIQSRLGISRKGLFNTDIQFGLRDISERLSQLNNRMLFESNQGYREISANIINDMLDGSFDRDTPSLVDRPDKEALALFFSRLKQGIHIIGHFDGVRVPDIDRIYNEGASTDSSNKFLNYFLGKLNSVIIATRSIEGLVEDFANHCNAYLGSSDPSVELGDKYSPLLQDDKMLEIDRLTLQVSVVSKSARRPVPMDSLSSGEKQMVSLFAKLFLYDGPKIVLIDEPELSLSIDWQRRILLDVVGAPTCAQLIAITHSPFVFDNELEPFARPLTLVINAIAETGESDIRSIHDVE